MSSDPNLIPDALLRAFADRIYLPFRDVARLLEVDQRTLRRHVRSGNIEARNVGLGPHRQRLMFMLSDVMQFLEKQRLQNLVPVTSNTKFRLGQPTMNMARRIRPIGKKPTE